MNEEALIKYYNKFNEDKRLNTRHGIIEYSVTKKYLYKYLKKYNNPKIIDIGAGTGKYSIDLSNNGYDVTAIELVKHNLRIIQSKNKNIKAFQGNAKDLSRFKDKSFDIVLLFGPMYHLITQKEKVQALKEAKRILKEDGIIMISYYMNDYAIIKHGFIDNNILDSKDSIDNKFNITSKNDDLYSYMRLKEINKLNKTCNLKRIKIISQDGPTDYIRSTINKMDNNTFDIYLKYILSICEQKELIGASSHVLDILKKY